MRRCCRPGSPAPAIRTAHDPYFLYAASNLGSLIALLGYPFVLEPAFGLKELSRLWTVGFLLLMAALALCLRADAQRARRRPTAAGADRQRCDATPAEPSRPGPIGSAGSAWRWCRRRC